MLLDLSGQLSPPAESADVLIIGAGTCGLVLADALVRQGLRTVVLESGDQHAGALNLELNEVMQLARPYKGAQAGRTRGLGGTSTLWGGALLPFLPEDLAARADLGLDAWPVAYEELARQIPMLEQLFGLDHSGYDATFLAPSTQASFSGYADAELLTRFAKWPRFKARNTARLFAQTVHHHPGMRVWLNATATAFEFSAGPEPLLKSVQAEGPGGERLTVSARRVVVCAGAIESTRLLLLMREQSQGRVLGSCDALGRGFHDHLSIELAQLRPRRPGWLNRLASFRFEGSSMRSFRLEMAPAQQRRLKSPSAWVHISFEAQGSSGFEALRDVMRALQRRELPRLSLLGAMLADLPYFVKLAYWRVVRQQLAWPTPARYALIAVAEQLPHPSNTITLGDQTDRHGNRLAAIHWDIRPQDVTPFNAMREAVQAYWARHGLLEEVALDWRVPDRAIETADLADASDIFHPGGTTRMGKDGLSAVVDADLRSFDIANLHVLSTSTFPTGAGANPTMTLLLFGLRLAEHLVQGLSAKHATPVSTH